MRAASREAYTTAAEKLLADAAQSEPAGVVAAANEILQVAGVLQREPRLRRALADPARSADERVALLRGLLEGKIGAGSLGVLAALVAGRMSSAADLLDATERLGVEGLLAAADQAGELGDVEDELFRFGQVVSGDNRLAATLGDVSVPAAQRAVLLRDLLDGKARAATVRLAELALTGFGGRSFDAGLHRMVELAAARRDRQVAYVTAAQPLTEAEEQRLAARLAAMYGREVSLKIEVDPEILGGLSVKVGSDLYDGKVLRRLNETRTALAGRR